MAAPARVAALHGLLRCLAPITYINSAPRYAYIEGVFLSETIVVPVSIYL
jgi:hypothetical protein